MKKPPSMLYLRETPLQSAFIFYLFVIGLVCIPVNFLGAIFTPDETLQPLIGIAVSRAVFFVIMLLCLRHLGFSRLLRPNGVSLGRCFLLSLPALAVAVNNAPLIELITGQASISPTPAAVVLFALQCLFVGAFEETAFRGVIFPLVLEKTGTEGLGKWKGVIFSAALFGLVHLVNLLGGGGIGSVAMQIGYSFLLGALLAILLYAGVPLWFAVAVHALYNFCGMSFDTLGGAGTQWSLARIALTAVLAVLAGIYALILLHRSGPGPANALFGDFPVPKRKPAPQEGDLPAEGQPPAETEDGAEGEPPAGTENAPSEGEAPTDGAKGESAMEAGLAPMKDPGSEPPAYVPSPGPEPPEAEAR